MDNFTFTDIERIIPHAKRSTVQLWVNSGLIIPKQNQSGRGLSRIYSFDNLMEIWAATELSIVWGISTEGLRYLSRLSSFRDAVKNKTRFYSLCLSRGEIGGWMRKSGATIQGNEGFTSSIQLNFDEISKEIKKRI